MPEPTPWPTNFEKTPRLTLATVGRRTDKIHKVTINFATADGRVFVVSSRKDRDWVKNLPKNPKVEVTVKEATR